MEHRSINGLGVWTCVPVASRTAQGRWAVAVPSVVVYLGGNRHQFIVRGWGQLYNTKRNTNQPLFQIRQRDDVAWPNF